MQELSDNYGEIISIKWNFHDRKTLKDRFYNALINCESVTWTINQPCVKNAVINGTWWFSQDSSRDHKIGWHNHTQGKNFYCTDGFWAAGKSSGLGKVSILWGSCENTFFWNLRDVEEGWHFDKDQWTKNKPFCMCLITNENYVAR